MPLWPRGLYPKKKLHFPFQLDPSLSKFSHFYLLAHSSLTRGIYQTIVLLSSVWLLRKSRELERKFESLYLFILSISVFELCCLFWHFYQIQIRAIELIEVGFCKFCERIWVMEEVQEPQIQSVGTHQSYASLLSTRVIFLLVFFCMYMMVAGCKLSTILTKKIGPKKLALIWAS